jgi:hypothetical protein
MRSVCIAVAAAALLLLLPATPASAQVRHSCGNYGHTENGGDKPVLLDEELWLMRCFGSGERLLKFRFGA